MNMEYSDESTTYELADVGTRFIAIFIDTIIVNIIAALVVGLTHSPGTWIIGPHFGVGLIYSWYFLTRRNGQTPGKSLMKIMVIKTDGNPISDADAIMRFIGYYINTAVIFIGWLWATWDENHQGWHDKIASTYVVRA